MFNKLTKLASEGSVGEKGDLLGSLNQLGGVGGSELLKGEVVLADKSVDSLTSSTLAPRQHTVYDCAHSKQTYHENFNNKYS